MLPTKQALGLPWPCAVSRWHTAHLKARKGGADGKWLAMVTQRVHPAHFCSCPALGAQSFGLVISF